jgi:transcriptional regulator with XRE-family HTH domain
LAVNAEPIEALIAYGLAQEEADDYLSNVQPRPDDVTVDLGRRIREARVALGLSQVDLAGNLRIDQRTVSQYEGGTVDIPVTRLLQIAGALKVSAGELLGESHVDDLERWTRKVESELNSLTLAQVHFIIKYVVLDMKVTRDNLADREPEVMAELLRHASAMSRTRPIK